ncbi:50S ribosomal protein L29 [Phycisphaera mikurensis]|uniref:Large ribosomal subunit protein uL29 n=1 Tax=Phycisphaera mikurensis (strain NBRC 102666 / KCTC 22515 / FYK2301M01) TaxID=1142394 RepID=I0III1_PHYMF|nr:50S ribosomal protein L29 [Phycisphaera mikurensis]MBB6442775.1 large subunit ribosomal protein L29 [Phycisphaera mikurensis]BAM05069.1 50S ribosomal protein L29 [Phycisphaera mikurensis NBRC 102666]
MKNDEVTKMTDEQLAETLGQVRRELFDLRSKAVTEKVENNRTFGRLRRDVARVLTEQRRRVLGNAPASA